MNKTIFVHTSIVAMMVLVGCSMEIRAGQQNKTQLESPLDRASGRVDALEREVRHQLVTLPYYNVFDWLQATVNPDGTVTLAGQVTQPTTKSDAEFRVKTLEGATQVENTIEVLPLSTNDEQLRLALYRAIFQYESPLFKYATQSVPPIHIVVKNGHVALKGIVATPADSQLAYTAARQVSGVFEVQNELQIEGSASQQHR